MNSHQLTPPILPRAETRSAPKPLPHLHTSVPICRSLRFLPRLHCLLPLLHSSFLLSFPPPPFHPVTTTRTLLDSPAVDSQGSTQPSVHYNHTQHNTTTMHTDTAHTLLWPSRTAPLPSRPAKLRYLINSDQSQLIAAASRSLSLRSRRSVLSIHPSSVNLATNPSFLPLSRGKILTFQIKHIMINRLNSVRVCVCV